MKVAVRNPDGIWARRIAGVHGCQVVSIDAGAQADSAAITGIDCVVQAGVEVGEPLPRSVQQQVREGTAHAVFCSGDAATLVHWLTSTADVVVAVELLNDQVLDAALRAAVAKARLRCAAGPLQDALTRIGRVLSHDLSTPFRQIVSIVDLIEHARAAGDEQELGDLVVMLGTAASAGIGFSDALARLGRAGRPVPDERVLPGELLRSTSAGFAERCVLTTDGRLDLAVTGDEVRLRQVFDVLLDNAVRHRASPPPAHVRADFQRDGNWLRIDVSDDGPGIPVPRRDAIMLPFRKFGAAGVNGLGLAIANDILVAHGGSIRLDTTDPAPPGALSGARFTILLPLARG